MEPRKRGALKAAFALVVMAAASGCAAGPPDGDDARESTGQTSQALTACNAPIQDYANWITADPSHWVHVTAAKQFGPTLEYWMNPTTWFPPACVGGLCFPAYWKLSGTDGSGNTIITIDSSGNVHLYDVSDTISPTSCSSVVNGASTITGVSSPGGANWTLTLSKQDLS